MFRVAVFVFLLGFSAQALAQTNESQTITAELGKTVKIPSGMSLEEDERLASLVWTRDDETIVSMALNVTTYEDQRALLDFSDYGLRLKDLEFSDSARYEIRYVTTKGPYDSFRDLEVLASPIVTAQAIPVLDDGSGARVIVAECVAKGGSNTFSMSWYEGDEVLMNGTSSVDSENAENEFLTDSVLQLIMVVDAPSDNGRTVTCLVTDAFGREIEKEVELEITEPTTTVPTTTVQAYPLIVDFPNQKKITLVVGESTTLACRATGVPAPTVTWYHDGVSSDSDGTGETAIEIVANDYSVAGNYRCEAHSNEGDDAREITVDVQGPPVILGADELDNRTEQYHLDSEDEFVSLLCESDAYPAPEIKWDVDGANFTELVTSHELVEGDGRTSSYLNISSSHFMGDNAVSKVVCTAKNFHGDAQKAFIVTVPIATSNVGVIIAVAVVLVLVLVVLIAVTTYCLLARKRRGSMATNPESGAGVCPLSTCCGDSKVKSKELKEEDEIVTVEHVKEVEEEGTHEEKQKLTEAEEVPAKEEEKNEEQKEGEEDAEDGEKKAEEKSPKKKSKISLPMQCCKGDKKEKTTETEEGEVKGGEENKAGNGKTQAGEEAERDSGKGDTLEKVIEEEQAEK